VPKYWQIRKNRHKARKHTFRRLSPALPPAFNLWRSPCCPSPSVVINVSITGTQLNLRNGWSAWSTVKKKSKFLGSSSFSVGVGERLDTAHTPHGISVPSFFCQLPRQLRPPSHPHFLSAHSRPARTRAAPTRCSRVRANSRTKARLTRAHHPSHNPRTSHSSPPYTPPRDSHLFVGVFGIAHSARQHVLHVCMRTVRGSTCHTCACAHCAAARVTRVQWVYSSTQ